MKPAILFLRTLLLFVATQAIVAGSFAQPKGKEKTVADNTYGQGGTKTTFSARNTQIVLFQDANNNRRLVQVINTIGSGSTALVSTGSTYYDNMGKKSFFKLETVQKNIPVFGLQEQLAAGTRTSMSAWALQNGSKVNFGYNLTTNHFMEGSIFPDYTYKEETVLYPKVNSGQTPLKFGYLLTGNKHYTAKAPSQEYESGTETTEAYNDYDEWDGDYHVVVKKVYDKNGVLRHKQYTEYYPDGCEYEEQSYYDCHGVPQYEDYTWYDDEGYDYKYEGRYYKQGRMSAAYRYYDDEVYGYEETYDPLTGDAVYGWHPDLNDPDDFEPDTSDCPDAYTFWDHEFYIGPSLILEDFGGERKAMFGLQAAYNQLLSSRFGLTGSIGYNFRKDDPLKYTKLLVLAGVVYAPISTASYRDKISFSIQALAGISNNRQSYSGNSYSKTYFTADPGLQLNYRLKNKLGIGAILDDVINFSDGQTSNNIRGSVGLKMQF